MNKYKITIIILIFFLIWFASAIVRLENYHYAVQVGFCANFSEPINLIEKDKCLNQIKTRTNPIWHLLYGLKIL